jgi:hypothetical protein
MEDGMIRFEDVEAGAEALVILRRSGDTVGLAVSLEDGPDLEVFAPRDVALRIARP